MSAVSSVSVQELNRESNAIIIDVRSPAEFRSVHITAAQNMPLDQLDPKEIAALRSGDQPLYVVCKAGGRSIKACQALVAAGHQQVVNVEGGTDAWVAAGLAVDRGQGGMSLERQVRIAAGALVLIGVILSQTIHGGFVWLAGFVGAGLVFAGITDTCGMGLLLARMPWNR